MLFILLCKDGFNWYIVSARSWMSLEHQGGLNPTTKEGRTFPFYRLVGLYVKFYLP